MTFRKILPIYLLLDTSSSMDEHGKASSAVSALKFALDAMRVRSRAVGVTCMIRLLQFDNNVRASDFAFIDQFALPEPLRLGGSTNITAVLRQVSSELKNELSSTDYFSSPLILMLTDGQHVCEWGADPADEDLMAYVSDYFLLSPSVRDAVRVAIAIGEYVDREFLEAFTSPGVPVLFANNSEDLANFIKWTSNAIGAGVAGLLGAGVPSPTGKKSW